MTHFWIPRTRLIEPKDAIQLPGIGIAGQMQAIRIGPDGKERWRGPWCKNLWTDAGLNYLFGLTSGNPVLYGEVGTGNTAPSVGDTSLQARVAQSASWAELQTYNLVDPGGGALFYGYETRRHTFNPIGTSYNLAEFGFRIASDVGTLGVRSLFRDINGLPTTVTWLTGETLMVDHQIRYYGSPADVTGTLTMGTSNQVHDLLLRPTDVLGVAGFLNSTGAGLYPPISTTYESEVAYTGTVVLGSYTQSISGTATGVSAETIVSYGAGSFYRELQAVWGQTLANDAEGIKAFSCSAKPGAHKVQFTPAVMKTSTDTLTLTFSSPQWSRYTP